MPISYSTLVDCHEMNGSPVENWSDEAGLDATVTLKCLWADRYTLVNDLLSNTKVYPHEPSSLARAMSAGITPFSAKVMSDGQGTTYELAVVTVNYRNVVYDGTDPENIQIFADSLEPNAEFQTLDHTLFEWSPETGPPAVAARDLKEKEAPGRLLISFDYVQTQYRVPGIPSAYMNLVGHVNDANVASSVLGLTFPTETLLWQPPKPQRSVNTVGDPWWTVTKRMSFKPEGWNKFWDAKEQTYRRMRVKDTGVQYDNFPLGDFSGVVS